jgi:hypothetical protein
MARDVFASAGCLSIGNRSKGFEVKMEKLIHNRDMSEVYDWVDDPDVPFRVLLDYVESLPELTIEENSEQN